MAKQKSPANLLADQIIDHIFSCGGYAWRNNSQGTADLKKGIMRPAPKVGVSDVLGVVSHKTFKQRPPVGRLVAIEVKIGRDTLSDAQAGFLEAMKRRGAICFVAKTFEDFLEQWKSYGY